MLQIAIHLIHEFLKIQSLRMTSSKVQRNTPLLIHFVVSIANHMDFNTYVRFVGEITSLLKSAEESIFMLETSYHLLNIIDSTIHERDWSATDLETIES